MGQIRKQTIQSSFLSYAGFLIGALNTYFFTKQGIFTPEQYGLTQTIISLVQLLAPLGTLGVTAYMGRFYPWYEQNLTRQKNDMLTIAFIIAGAGTILLLAACLVFEPLLMRKFSARSPLLMEYYYWSLVFMVSFLCFMVLEVYFATLKRTVFPNFMKETVYRAGVTILIGLYAFQLISFKTFVILFCCIYLVLVIIMIAWLALSGYLHLTFKLSTITRRIAKPAAIYTGFVYSGIAVNAIAKQIDTLAVASVRNLSEAGVYTLNQFAAAVIQVPYRALLAISAPLIALHWKNKNLAEIDRIYKRASINMLLISAFLFLQIWLNYDDGLQMLGLNTQFASGKLVFLILGIYNIIDLTVGISSPVISTSPAWRFEFYSGLFLLAISIPLNIFMARWAGMYGVALATLITFTVYNSVRVIYVKKRFGIWPFTVKTLQALMLIGGSYGIIWLLFHNWHGIAAIVVRSSLLTVLYLGGVFYLKITPDLHQLRELMLTRIKRK